MRFKEWERTNSIKVKMLDWDFREWLKRPEMAAQRHINLAKEYEFDVVMSRDVWKKDFDKALNYADTLSKYCDRVVVPVHWFSDRLLDYELAYPNANWFAKNSRIPNKYRDNFTHILGGSPHEQYKLITTNQEDLYGHKLRLRNIISVDGNQIFNVSIRANKYWQLQKPHWVKLPLDTPNVESFKISVNNVNKLWNGHAAESG